MDSLTPSIFPPTNAPPPATNANTSAAASSATPITLNVGGTPFVVLRDTLSSSLFFQGLLSGRWEHNRLADGSYFVDWEPEVFRHVLKYLRTGHLPSCWKGLQHGFDYEFAEELREAAEFFGVEELREWLQEKRFLEKVRVEISIERCRGAVRSTYGNGNVPDCHVQWVSKNVGPCPKGQNWHNEHIAKCRQQCGNASAAPMDHQMDPLVLVIKKKVVYRENIPDDENDERESYMAQHLGRRVQNPSILSWRRELLQGRPSQRLPSQIVPAPP
ncbi:hypothetical protein IWX90DRAFT_475021 [Phyllosticta citrichinensis]|uniref:BTB domain-containing protein n=1 Tax=Phyllosticta citrichinensis TaxID=1130410 RepID=A0ABR1Y1M4_9PEZI